MEPILVLLIVGALGGLIRCFLGYETQADDGETFNYMKMLKSLVRASILGASVVMVLMKPDTIMDTQFYIGAFMIAIGADVISKEGYGTVLSKVNK